jgi:hypothetical protein
MHTVNGDSNGGGDQNRLNHNLFDTSGRESVLRVPYQCVDLNTGQTTV